MEWDRPISIHLPMDAEGKAFKPWNGHTLHLRTTKPTRDILPKRNAYCEHAHTFFPFLASVASVTVM